jgi:hypothetical protein
MSRGRWKRVVVALTASLLVVAMVPAVGSATKGKAGPTARASQLGYVVTFCRLPATGLAIRAGDRDSSTELGRVYNGNVGRVYATSASEPSISPGWGAGYGRLSDGRVQHGYFKLAYTC